MHFKHTASGMNQRPTQALAGGGYTPSAHLAPPKWCLSCSLHSPLYNTPVRTKSDAHNNMLTITCNTLLNCYAAEWKCKWQVSGCGHSATTTTPYCPRAAACSLCIAQLINLRTGHGCSCSC